jgi:LysR family glycine cleavage system transcriptional activator
MHRLPPLNPLVAFEASSRHRSFTKAARELNVTQGAVSRQVAVLEEFFGAPLFERRSKEIVLTPSAAAYAEAVRGALDQLRVATEVYRSASATPSLTIKGYNLLLNHWLIPRLPDFTLHHPRIDIRLVATSGAVPVDLASDCVDIDIRRGAGTWSGSTAHMLFPDELTPVCSPLLLKKLRLNSPKDIAGRVILQTRTRGKDWHDWANVAGLAVEPVLQGARSLESLGAVYQSALNGEGIALLQRAYLEDDLAAGRLALPFGPVLRRRSGHYLVYPTERAHVPEIEAFRDWILGIVARPGRSIALRSIISRPRIDNALTSGAR